MKMYGDLVVLGDTVVARMGFSQEASDNYAAMVNHAADTLAEMGVNFYNVTAPTSVGILVSSDFLPQIGSADQGKILRYVFALQNGSVRKVNPFNRLLSHKDEYIYYHGDHHWTALGAYYAYEEFCDVAGFDPVPLSKYTEVNMGRFTGTYYIKANSPKSVTDEMIAYVPPGDVSMYIKEYPKFTDPVWDLTNGEPSAKYNCFIAGDNNVTILTNDSVPGDSTCLVLKDSFGNPFVIYLMQHYHTVVVLDYRHVQYSLSRAVQEYQPQDVILMQSIGVSQSRSTHKLMNSLLR